MRGREGRRERRGEERKGGKGERKEEGRDHPQ